MWWWHSIKRHYSLPSVLKKKMVSVRWLRSRRLGDSASPKNRSLATVYCTVGEQIISSKTRDIHKNQNSSPPLFQDTFATMGGFPSDKPLVTFSAYVVRILVTTIYGIPEILFTWKSLYWWAIDAAASCCQQVVSGSSGSRSEHSGDTNYSPRKLCDIRGLWYNFEARPSAYHSTRTSKNHTTLPSPKSPCPYK